MWVQRWTQMAMHDVFLKVGFKDASSNVSEVTYLLNTQFNDADTTTMDDVLAQVTVVMTYLNTLTMDQTIYHNMYIALGSIGAPPNVNANNQVFAFSRVELSDGTLSSVEVPAWDDTNYAQDENHLIGAALVGDAYNSVVYDLTSELRDAKTGLEYGGGANRVKWSQSRARKSRAKRLV